MNDDLEDRGHHAITHNDETYIKLADASVTFGFYRKDIAAKDAEIARLRAEIEAQTKRNFETELRFWEIVDRDGLTGLPSDMWEALAQLVKDRAAIATARNDAANRLEELRQAPREIAMGHGLVDVCVCNHEGRYGLVLKPRANYVAVGEETAPLGSLVTLDGGCVVVWFDGPEFGTTVIDAIEEAAAIRSMKDREP